MQFSKASRPLRGTITVPGDKSISHRAVMFGSIAEGTTEITNFLPGADCLSTISCFRQMGVEITPSPDNTRVQIRGRGLHGLHAPAGVLDCGNSGTTMRLMSGILAGQPFPSVLTGDASIRKRPMMRVIRPLKEMGADIRSFQDTGCAPLEIGGLSAVPTSAGGLSDPAGSSRSADSMPCPISRPARLRGTIYHSPVASAQVKSCVLLAGLYADSPVIVTEPFLSRNHTELMLRSFGADVYTGTFEEVVPFLTRETPKEYCGLPSAAILPDPALEGISVKVPGDISSAAYFLCAALMVPGSHVILKNVGINPTRDGILRTAAAMGADIVMHDHTESGGEPAADLEIRSATLHGTVIEGDLIPTLIDELPVIAVLAACADGDTIIRDAGELRVKESDRLTIITESLSAMGVSVDPLEDGMIIHGGKPLHGAALDSYGDHRIAMSFAIAALCAEGNTKIRNAECVNISYPGFFADLVKLQAGVR